MTDEQIRYAFQLLMGIAARPSDVATIKLLGATEEAMGEYLWDHWLGEPKELTAEAVADLMHAAVDDLDPKDVAAELDAAGDCEMASIHNLHQHLRARMLALRFPEIANEAAGSEPGESGPVA